MIIKSQILKLFVFNLLIEVGTNKTIADFVSSKLVNANLSGHPSHGVMRLPLYVDKILKKELRPNLKPKIINSKKDLISVDGLWGFGQVSAKFTMDRCIKLAKKQTIAIATLKNANHIGRLSDYSNLCAKKNMIGIVTANLHGTSHIVSPYGGIERKLPSNPISFSCPTGYKDNFFIADLSTSSLAEGKLKILYNEKLSVKEGHIIDNRGNKTNDPKKFYEEPKGSILPFGGESAHKGYALSLMVDILSGALSRGGCSSLKYKRHGNAVTFIAINIKNILPFKSFCNEVELLKNHVKSSKQKNKKEIIYFPGEREKISYFNNLKNGIKIDKSTITSLKNLAKYNNIKFNLNPE